MVAATSAACIHDVITSLPKVRPNRRVGHPPSSLLISFWFTRTQGYDTKVAPRGGNLSGGERRRICIARLLLQLDRMLAAGGLPPVVILDEPLESLDPRTAASVRSRLLQLQQVGGMCYLPMLWDAGPHDRVCECEGRVRTASHFTPPGGHANG